MRPAVLSFIFFVFGLSQLKAQCISGDCQNGTGIFIYPSGAKYVGQFRNGEIHGIGSCYYSDGSVYRGNWSQRYPEGKGTKTLSDGRSWSGSWKRGLPVDSEEQVIDNIFPTVPISGQLMAEELVIQFGCLSGDCENGYGVMGYSDGSRYEGSFKNHKADGFGHFNYANGDYYKGEFREGLKHGNGALYSANGEKRGTWKEGEFMDSLKSGLGCIAGDCVTGIGTYVYKDAAATYMGRFENGLPQGEGVITYTNGDRYEGKWENGTFNGKGTLFMADGTSLTGSWKDGEFLGEDQPRPDFAELSTFVNPEEYIAIRNSATMKVWALLIGISTYNHMPTLRYTDDDAYRMLAFLKSPEGGALSDEQIKILVDEDATRERILNSLREVFAKAGANDLILVYYSGHGLRGAFLPIDFDGYNNRIEHEEINEILNQGPAKYKLVIADACYAGSLLAAKGVETHNLLADYYRTLANASPGTALILSSKSEEISLESSGLRQGVFSHFLIRGLKGDADKDQDRMVTVKELFDFIKTNVSDYTLNRQNPIISGSFDPSMPVSIVRR